MKRKSENLDLFAHQKQAVDFLKGCEREEPCSWLLSDEMGVGKTLEVLALLRESERPGPWLIVTPSKAKKVWVDELRKFKRSTGWECEYYEVPSSQGGEWSATEEPFILFITYTLLGMIYRNCNEIRSNRTKTPTANAAQIYSTEWERVILDEAHTIRSPSILSSRACMALKAKCRGAISGTPIHNVERDIQTLAMFLHVQQVSSLLRYRTLRRMVNEVAKTNEKFRLPNITHYTMEWPFATENERMFYESKINGLTTETTNYERGMVERKAVLQMIIHAQLACAAPCCVGGDRPSLLEGRPSEMNIFSTKMQMLVTFCEKHQEDDILVYSQWTSVLRVARAALTNAKFNNTALLTGGTNDQLADSIVRDLFARTGRGTRIILASIGAFNQSLNWPFFNRVVFLTPNFNPQVEYQAWKRVHRFGQTREVKVTYMLISGTIDKRTRQIAEQKRKLESQILDPTRSTKHIREVILSELPRIEKTAKTYRVDEEDGTVVTTNRELTEETETKERLKSLVKMLMGTPQPLGEFYKDDAVLQCRAMDDWREADEAAGFPFPNVFAAEDETLKKYKQRFAPNHYTVKFQNTSVSKKVAVYEDEEAFLTKVTTLAIQAGISDPRLLSFKLFETANAIRQVMVGEQFDPSRAEGVPFWGVAFSDGALLAFWPLKLFIQV